MAESQRDRVTITLGRSGQVVKRSGAASSVNRSDSRPVAGTKRSVRDRLGGNNTDSCSIGGNQVNNKRQRGDGQMTSSNANSLNGTNLLFCIATSIFFLISELMVRLLTFLHLGEKDFHIGKNDLRFKLMQKNVFRGDQSDNNPKGMDLRQKLTRMGQPPVNSSETRRRMLDSREQIHVPRGRMPESRETGVLGKIHSARSVDDYPRMTTSSLHSPWTLEHIRRRSPDRVMDASRGSSPPRNVELQRRPVNRTYNDVRTVPYMGKDVLDAPRPVSGTTTFVTKSTLPTTSAKPMPPVPPIPSTISPSNIVQKSPYLGVEQQTVDGLLHSLGLGKYVIILKAEEVDMTALKQMGDNDLKELGIPMGPRKKILLALLPRFKRQP